MNIGLRFLLRFSKPFSKKIEQSNYNQDAVKYAENPCDSNVVRKPYIQQRNSTEYKEKPCAEFKNALNSSHLTHNTLQTFLDISPISLMLDIGNKIIDRKGKHVNRDYQPNANKTQGKIC